MAGDKKSVPEVGDEVEVTVESVAFGGDGVARHAGYVLFVPDVLPGERVSVRITTVKRSFGRGVAVGIMEASPDRTKPRCDVYGVCGGCQYQHVAYERSLAFKQEQIRDVVGRIGGMTVDDICEPVRPSPEAYGYRNVISLRVKSAGNGKRVGYTARDNKTFLPVSHCPIASQAINDTLAGVTPLMEGMAHAESIKSLTIKSAGGEVLVSPVYRKPLRFRSDRRLCYRYGPLDLCYGPQSFFQVNHAMVPGLIDLVKDGLAPGPDEMLLDLYAGVGLFSLALAGAYRRVIGVEAGEEAVACFEANIGESGIKNVSVVRGTVEANLDAARREIEGKKVSVVVDPPREGMKAEVVEFLREAPVGKLIYVSCDPGTLARDLKRLAPAFTVRKITPLDMFPQTKHIETVAVLDAPGI